MTEEVAPALAEALRKQDKLVRLNLNDTSLKDEGIQAIAEVFRSHHNCLHERDIPFLEPDICVAACPRSVVILPDAGGATEKGRTLTLWALGLIWSSSPARSRLMCSLQLTSRTWSGEVRLNEVMAEGMQALTSGACLTAVLQFNKVLYRFSWPEHIPRPASGLRMARWRRRCQRMCWSWNWR